MPEPEGKEQRERLHIGEFSGIAHSRQRRELDLTDDDVLLLLGEPATTTVTILGAVRPEVEVHLLGGDTGHAPDGADMFEGAERHTHLLTRFPLRPLFRVVLVEQACRHLDQGRDARGEESRRPELLDEKSDFAIRVVGQDGDGAAMILDLALDAASIRQRDVRDEEPAPSA